MDKPAEKTFTKTVDGIGSFTFRYTTLLDELAIDGEITTLLGGNPNPSIGASNIATMIGTLKVATVKAPEGFDLKDLYSYDDLKAVYDAYTETVSAFRTRQGNKGDCLVPGEGI